MRQKASILFKILSMLLDNTGLILDNTGLILDNTDLNFAFRNLDFSMGFIFLSGRNSARCVLAASWVYRKLYTFTKKIITRHQIYISRCLFNVLRVIMHNSFKLIFISHMHYKSCVLFLCYSFVLHSALLGIGDDFIIAH
jgi:hypothetical protein